MTRGRKPKAIEPTSANVVRFGDPWPLTSPDPNLDNALMALTAIIPRPRAETVIADIRRMSLAYALKMHYGYGFRIVGMSRDMHKHARTIGDLFGRLLKLCDNCHRLQSGELVEVSSCSEFTFTMCVLEMEVWWPYGSEIVSCSKKISKMAEHNKKLRYHENPFEQPFTRRLFDVACSAAKSPQGKAFNKETYRPFVKARSLLISWERKSRWPTWKLEGDKIERVRLRCGRQR